MECGVFVVLVVMELVLANCELCIVMRTYFG